MDRIITGFFNSPRVWKCSVCGWAVKARSQDEAMVLIAQSSKSPRCHHDPRPAKPTLKPLKS